MADFWEDVTSYNHTTEAVLHLVSTVKYTSKSMHSIDTSHKLVSLIDWKTAAKSK